MGDESADHLTIPENLYLIGTMNSTDRSLAMIDYALRRRFYFWRLMPVVDGRAPVLEGWLAGEAIPMTQLAQELLRSVRGAERADRRAALTRLPDRPQLLHGRR